MRLYHFLEKRWALDDMRNRRLRISKLESLNDPFEFLGIALVDTTARARLLLLRHKLAQDTGLLCFSKNWSNPLMWSHYGGRHAGICLGFDVPEDSANDIKYVAGRASRKLLAAIDDGDAETADAAMRRLLYTKYRDWAYEAEVRVFVELDSACSEGGEFFLQFAPNLCLREVIVGPVCDATRADVEGALSGVSGVKCRKARLAYNSFRVVPNLNKALWI